MADTCSDWLALAMQLRETSGVLLLPWKGYSQHFSEPMRADGHEPQWVDDVIQQVNELDHEMLTVLTGYMIIVARQEMGRN